MISYELATELKIKGFPQKVNRIGDMYWNYGLIYSISHGDYISPFDDYVPATFTRCPSLEDLIEACEKMFVGLINFKICCGLLDGLYGLIINTEGEEGKKTYGPYKSKEELFIDLWLELHKNDTYTDEFTMPDGVKFSWAKRKEMGLEQETFENFLNRYQEMEKEYPKEDY